VVQKDDQLSYGELNARANRLAWRLRGLGVEPDARVGLCVERSLDMMIGLLGILKAGAAYVPLDPTYPPERLSYMLSDSRPVVTLTRPETSSAVQAALRVELAGQGESVPSIDLEADARDWVEQSDGNPDRVSIGLTPGHLAYVIYTSGSTGKPKGAPVGHRNLANLVHWHSNAFELRNGERSSCLAGLGFDAAAWEIWPPLCVGATLLLPSSKDGRNTEDLLTWWENEVLDVSFLPTPVAELAFARGMTNPYLRTLLVGGDRLRYQPDRPASFSLINNYGPTEITVVATSGRIETSETSLHIGRPISNTRIYIVGAGLEPAPVGVAGEIYIGGAGVARGYLNRPDLTAERFVADPFADEANARMYKSGDVGRYLPDGRIEFLGRNDFQVKIRGFRVELGEVEARLEEQPGIRKAVVVAHENGAGDKYLVAYYTTEPEKSSETTEAMACALRENLSAVLPEYMAPAAYVKMEAMPLTSNGKLDRRALPAPDGTAYAASGYEAPVGEIETMLAEIWADLLNLERVSRHDNFFALGGYSLLVTKLIARIRKELGVEIKVQELFSKPTLFLLAKHLTDTLLAELTAEDLENFAKQP
jgi:amino acid adenylation domain-containing protein